MDEDLTQLAERLRQTATTVDVSVSDGLIIRSHQRGRRATRRRRAARVAGVASVVLAVGATAGIAAAYGGRPGLQQVTTGRPGQSVPPVPPAGSDSGHPRLSGVGPSTTLSPIPPVDPGTVSARISSPGPGGTTMSLVASAGTGDARGDVCYEVTVSDVGAPSEPGKPAFRPLSRCIAAVDVHPVNQAVGELGAELYRSRSGAGYMIAVGQAKDAGSVTYTLADHTTTTVRVVNGWYLVSIPYTQYTAGYGEVAYDANGRTIGWGGAPGQAPGAP